MAEINSVLNFEKCILISPRTYFGVGLGSWATGYPQIGGPVCEKFSEPDITQESCDRTLIDA